MVPGSSPCVAFSQEAVSSSACSLTPLRHQARNAAVERAFEDFAGRDGDLGLVLAVAGVDVRRRMVLVVQVDGDAVEEAEPGHLSSSSPGGR